jgi:hypothetical protein
VYALVADLARMGEWSPEATSVKWLGGASGARSGARFRGTNRNGWHRWRTTCTVVRAEPGAELSWEARTFGLPVALWRYVFAPDGAGGTVVTESTQDRRGSLVRVVGTLATGVRDRAPHNEETMRATLEHLKAAAERHAG